MIVMPVPNIDKRAAADLAGQLQQLLSIYEPAWNDVNASTSAPEGLSAALIGVAARFAEIIIQRLNQVPQKNFLAFLELLGATLLPPQPARVPLTFSLAKGSVADGLVPAGTQVAAPPAPGEKDPVIFETENELVVTSAQLTSAFVRDPEQDTYADYSNSLMPVGSAATSIFHGNYKMEHILYIGHSQLLNSPGISNLSLTFTLKSPAGDALNLRWEIWDGTQWHDRTPDPANDQTQNLQQSGTIRFGAIPPVPATGVNNISMGWIRCRLPTPITPAASPRDGMARAGQLPQIRSVGTRVHLHKDGIPVEAAFTNLFPIDLSKDFFPFGEKPRFNDTLWMALEEAFSNAGATITLAIKLTNPSDSTIQFPKPTKPSDDLTLQWEIWSGSAWVVLGTSTPKGGAAAGGNPFTDTTNAFTKDGQVGFTLPSQVASFTVNGRKSFWIRVRIAAGNYGVEGHFEEINPVPPPPESAFKFVLPTFQAPCIKSLVVTYDQDSPGLSQKPAQPEAVLTFNDFTWSDVTEVNNSQSQSFAPFKASQDMQPTLYLGFVLPPGRTTFPNSAISIFFRTADLHYAEKTIPLAPDMSRGAVDPSSTVLHRFFVTNNSAVPATFNFDIIGTQWKLPNNNIPPATILTTPSPITVQPGQSSEVDVQVTVPPGTAFGEEDSGFFQLTLSDQTMHTAEFITFCHLEAPRDQQVRLRWEYWNGHEWTALAVRDDTNSFMSMGAVEFLAPPDFEDHSEFGVSAWWLRVRWEAGDYDTDPRVNRVLLNTTTAAQVLTIRREVLGSSDGSSNQTFQTTRAPILNGQNLEVREPEMPSGGDLEAILDEEGADAITMVRDAAGTPSEIWVRWHEVPDFYGSDSRSRHYTLDHLTGQVRFGDGLSGLIPPVASGNVRLAAYRTGGGTRGNRAVGSVVQMKTTLPYIDKVTNYDPASGGAEGESLDSLLSRAPTEIRHRHRAVTSEDYQDLARLASPDVARALCVSNRDLEADPLDQMPPVPGAVSVIIVPNTTDPIPQPSTGLLKRVQDFLSTSSPSTATVLVIGPVYLRVDVQVEIGLASLDSSGTVAQKVQDTLAAFLHPLTGGVDGQGWDFGREPHRSDLYAVLKKIPEVDHIRSLDFEDTEDFPGIRATGRFLVHSGTHTVKLVFEPS